MARWTDLAPRQERTANEGGPMIEHRGLVLHTAEGWYEGTISWEQNPASQVSSHFVAARDGRIAQVVDTDVTAWTQRAGNGHWLSAECEGFGGSKHEALTDAQIEALAKLLTRTHQVYGVPLQVCASPDGRGLGHHSMGGTAWGHLDCPGPQIIAQKPAIVARAKQLAEGDRGMTFDEWKNGLIGQSKPAGMGGPDNAIRMADWVGYTAGTLAGLAAAVKALGDQVAALTAEVATLKAGATPTGDVTVSGTVHLGAMGASGE
jgi:hypothetical protein